MLYAFELSGDHPEIAGDEVLACLQTEGIIPECCKHYDHCTVVGIAGDPGETDKKLAAVADRPGMCHHILKIIGITDNDPETIRRMAEESDISSHIDSSQTFAVRARRVNHHTSVNCTELEGRVGGTIFRKGFRADLKNPDVPFRLILTEKCIFGTVIASVNRKAFHARAPHRKPFFYPGVLMPVVARAVVNLTGAKRGMKLLDPFCGTAGMLTEAALMGVNVTGVEVRDTIIRGAKLNLDAYGAEYNLIRGDASRLPFEDNSFDAIVTDPPYGRSAMIKAESLEKLYRESFREMFRVLGPGRRAVIVSEIPPAGIAREAGFAVIAEYSQRVHKSLTRNIVVLEKGPCRNLQTAEDYERISSA
jgi:tRNA (guanine10-N2)-dimethyltransferase